MSTIEKSITVEVPVRTAYDQWTQFESFPEFMEGVESVNPTPDERVTWRSLSGTANDGTVSFADAGEPGSTQVTLHLDFEPEGAVEKVGDVLNIVERRVNGDLERFKEFIWSRGAETGAWRGDIKPTGEVRPDGTPS